jgi:hypothetical protein
MQMVISHPTAELQLRIGNTVGADGSKGKRSNISMIIIIIIITT